MDRRILLAAATAIAAIVLFVLFRPGGDDGTTTTRVELRVEDGRPVGGVERVELRQDEQVVVVVSSDVADEVHVHGYDLMRDVAPGEPARIAFRARLAGSFEVELESRHLLLAELQVQP